MTVPSDYKALHQGFMVAFSTHFNVGIFSVTECVGVIQLVFAFLSKGIDLHVAVYSVLLWD